ncbi:hypothetical protein ABZ714_27775 [Streptomyces sp. NPDC006798]|uniref:hypothetical protein n=1 Tax=Streptomyces sp. NPDC006798 TaxID=3155462 RepID=UPI0033D05A5E
MNPSLRRRAGTAFAAVALAAAAAALTPAAVAAAGAAPAPAGISAATTEAAATVTYLRAFSGDSQTVTAGRPVPQALTVKAMDVSFAPVEGAVITFITPGELTFPGGATTATAVTGADGTAQAPTLTAGTVTGPFLITATANDREAQTGFEIIIH